MDRLGFHVDVPDFERQVVARDDISSFAREFDVRDRGDDFRKEGFVLRVLFFLKDWVIKDG